MSSNTIDTMATSATQKTNSQAEETVAEMLKALRDQEEQLSSHAELKQELEEMESEPLTPDLAVLNIMREGELFQQLGLDELADKLEEFKDHILALEHHQLRILKGYRVNSQGKILDYEGKPIGKLCCGDPDLAVGATVGERGEIFDCQGNYLGHAVVLDGKAARRAYQEMME
ncbi:hypothetical protein AC579_724 [Pseudocercospora musae]|uniref:Uncharacterized protein n=1 Tax=Pseudocercospora musae TaxID=113226 RepID=A0A139I9E1_9PEZI|nr:hypothetical protein AC579_724 [Pseudocercospora musae]